MADTGWRSPTATGENHDNWINPSDAFSSDDQRAGVAYEYSIDLAIGISIDGGSSYSNTVADDLIYIVLPSASDGEVTIGSPTDLWNLSLTSDSFSDSNFRIVIAPEHGGGGMSGSHKQDYYDFDFGVPSGATIDGMEIKTEGYKVPGAWLVDHIQVKVYYTEAVTGYQSPFPAFRAP